MLVRPSGLSYSGTLRRTEINRDRGLDPAHTASPFGADVDSAELHVATGWRGGTLQLGVGYDDFSKSVTPDSGLRGFVRFSRGL